MSNTRKLAAVTKQPPAVPAFDAVLASITPRLTRLRLCTDGSLVDRIDELQTQMLAAAGDEDFGKPGSSSVQLRDDLRRATERAAAAEVEFVFQPIGARRWRELVAAHPPRAEDRAAGADFDTTTLPAAAMATCCVEPAGATVELFEQLADKVPTDQWDALWATVHHANTASGRTLRL